MKKFKLYSGEIIDDLGEYINDYLSEFPEAGIYIGTDSVDRYDTIYVSVVVFRHERKGAHVIFRKEHEKKSPDLFTKLWREVEKTNDLAHYVLDYMPEGKILNVDLDLNSLKRHASNIAHDAGKGYLIGTLSQTGKAFNVRSKPQAWSASRAADHLL